MYATWNGTQLYDLINLVRRKCSQRDLLEAAMKGGNVLPLQSKGYRKPVNYDIEHFVHLAPCIIPNLKYLTPQLELMAFPNMVFFITDVTPYSHPLALQFILSSFKIHYSTHCSQNTPYLSNYHILGAKGFLSV